MISELCIGIIGGTGQLGAAIAHGLLRNRLIAPEKLWISSRSNNRTGFESVESKAAIQFTTCNQDLIDHCDIVIIAVPPALSAALDINVKPHHGLLISVIAGVTIEQLQHRTGAERVIRAMSNPAAEKGLAYSPWCAGRGVTAEDREATQALFNAIGQTDEVASEDQIDQFTALIGPVPGFVAYYADCMVNYAVKTGIDPAIAERAVRQLFHASGVVLATAEASPAEQVKAMIDYAGTTAAGLMAMQALPLADAIAEGLDAAYKKSQIISSVD
ncbi:pyrroline-5-carboxylate reductase family protein [Amphritea pacifica]|uniref:Pyrroline-5-carboxylate reductase n=1 Tax=Amphritea pacifica TaxID=2811233 RepID=A0ABS2W6X3_9GAMM|nr:pyrroline-5-carboxylate reductase dimerization domain-containing protein [Amphritea pacifica]MBN0987336.1 NAD(P)-binding domain-containing protein [Amphritea pacifica]